MQPIFSETSEAQISPKASKLCKLGIEIAEKGDYKTALIYLERALDLEPKFTQALYNYASIQKYLGNNEESYVFFQRLLKVNPGDFEARL
ncbi:MAG TPA: tetratricopeptide repeat protein, partial [Vampirovibrionales bacterium]